MYEDHIGPESFTFLKDQASSAKAFYEEDRISLVTPIVIDEELLDGVTLFQL